MGNTFHGGGRALSLSNGGTAVFVDVLMLAVSDLADSVWEYRFATLLTLQDQGVMGRGAVGFDLEDIDWGRSPGEWAAAKGFVLRVLDLALRRHRWDELGYEPPFAEGYLRQYRETVEAFDPMRRRAARHRRLALSRPGGGRHGVVRTAPPPVRAGVLGGVRLLQLLALTPATGARP